MQVGFSLPDISVFILVFARIGGMIFFNPLLSRKNIPNQLKIALVLGIAILLAPNVPVAPTMASMTDFGIIFQLISELLLGAVFGYIFQVFYFLLFTAGDVIDMGFGLSMAKAFDPGSNVQLSMSGNLFQLFFALYFFVTDCHLVFIRLMASSYDLWAAGGNFSIANAAPFCMTLFISAFALVMHLVLPFMAASFILEISMGILMKLVPQINVFSLHFQMKILLGLGLMFLFALPTTQFLKNYINEIFVNLQNLLTVL